MAQVAIEKVAGSPVLRDGSGLECLEDDAKFLDVPVLLPFATGVNYNSANSTIDILPSVLPSFGTEVDCNMALSGSSKQAR